MARGNAARASENKIDISGRAGKNAFVKSLYDKAHEISRAAHAGQFRKDGKTPYFNHVEQVVAGVSDPDAKLVALLHDTVEDNRLSFDDLKKAGIPDHIIDGVRAMTKPKGMNYHDYVRNVVMKNPLARMVKLADIKANLADQPSDWQLAKYAKALDILNGVG